MSSTVRSQACPTRQPIRALANALTRAALVAGVSLALALWLSLAPSRALAASCDELSPDGSALGYAARGERCEGFYRSPTGGAFEMVSLVRGPIRYTLSPDVHLTVAAPRSDLVPVGEVRVRAVALPLRTYYRMDATLPENRTLAWPLADVVAPAHLSQDRIGIYAWTGEGDSKVFLPVRIAPEETKALPMPLELTFRSSVALDRVVLQVWEKASGAPAELTWREIGSGYAAGEPIVAQLPEGGPALLSVRVKAKPKGSDDWLGLEPFSVLRD